MMPFAFLGKEVKMVNLEGLGDLERMGYLENLAMMAHLEIKMI